MMYTNIDDTQNTINATYALYTIYCAHKIGSQVAPFLLRGDRRIDRTADDYDEVGEVVVLVRWSLEFD